MANGAENATKAKSHSMNWYRMIKMNVFSANLDMNQVMRRFFPNTKVQISCAVTAQLISDLVFATQRV